MLIKFIFFFSFLFSFHLKGGNSVVHVFGDSHCSEFWEIPGCVPHHLGAITMHRIGRDSLSIMDFSNYPILEGEAVVFAFGEIDVRCHIGKQRDFFHRTLEEIIEELAQKYFKTILLNRSSYRQLNCIIYSVTPPLDFYHPDYPPYGTLEDRVNITRTLNHKLSQLCAQYGFHFLDVYNDYAAPEGTLIREISDGVHILPHHCQAIQRKLNLILQKLY